MIPNGGGSIILISSMSANVRATLRLNDIINPFVNGHHRLLTYLRSVDELIKVDSTILRQNNQLQTPYNASKAAVKHLASSLAVEWAKDGVRVNSLRFALSAYFCGSELMPSIHSLNFPILNSPGYMMTKLTKTILDKDPELKVGESSRRYMNRSTDWRPLQATWERLTPMGRVRNYCGCFQKSEIGLAEIFLLRWEILKILTYVLYDTSLNVRSSSDNNVNFRALLFSWPATLLSL